MPPSPRGGKGKTAPNPNGWVGANKIIDKPVVAIPGCPPNPYAFLATVVHILMWQAIGT